MPYKISGNLSDDARVLVIKQADWSVYTSSDNKLTPLLYRDAI